MSDKKNIDRLFQEKFKNFEATPDDAVWENIRQALHKDERKRRVIPFWWKTAGVAALLALLFTVGNAVFNKGENFSPDPKMVDTEKIKSPSESIKGTTINETFKNSGKNEDNSSNSVANASDTVDSYNNTMQKSGSIRNETGIHLASGNVDQTSQSDTSDLQNEVKRSQKNTPDLYNSKQDVIAKNTSSQPKSNSNKESMSQDNDKTKTILESDKDPTRIAKVTDQHIPKNTDPSPENKNPTSNKEEESIEEAIAKARPTDEEEEEKEQPNRWHISPNVAPVYFNTLGKGSTIHSQFVNNTKSGEVNMSYGIKGSYAINDKIKVRAGVNKVNLGYSTDGVIAFSELNGINGNSGKAELRNINFKNQQTTNAYLSSSNINTNAAPQLLVSNVNGALEQQFGYIEVPLEVEYSLINNKFGMHVVGGFSTLFLNNNQVYSFIDSERFLLGEANNINRTSFSANFGLGFDYNVSRTLKLNLEPMFKYQINTFTNTSGDFRPYFIGVYTGFSFKF